MPKKLSKKNKNTLTLKQMEKAYRKSLQYGLDADSFIWPISKSPYNTLTKYSKSKKQLPYFKRAIGDIKTEADNTYLFYQENKTHINPLGKECPNLFIVNNFLPYPVIVKVYKLKKKFIKK